MAKVVGNISMSLDGFDIIDGPHGWSDEMGYGAAAATTPPVLVVTRRPPATMRLRNG